MKKTLCYVACSMILAVLLTGCSFREDRAVLPPSRIGREGTMKVSLAKEYGFESAFSESDLVAHVRVGDWLSENNETHTTYYDAEVIHAYKGENQKHITLVQDGDSLWTVIGYPLFVAGNELFVFLKRAIESDGTDTYWIIGSFTTVLDAVTTDSGKVYFVDRYGDLGKRTHELIDYVSDPELLERFKKPVTEANSFVIERQYQYPYVYSSENVEAWMKTK